MVAVKNRVGVVTLMKEDGGLDLGEGRRNREEHGFGYDS